MADQPAPDQPAPDHAPPYAVRSIVGLVAANSSLVLAVLIYMGWAYDDALYGYFHLSTLDLSFGPLEYALRSLNLFSPDIVIVAVLLAAVMSVRPWGGPRAVLAAVAHVPVIHACRRMLRLGPADRGHAGQPSAARSGPVSREHQDRTTGTLLAGAGVLLMIIALVLYWGAMHVRISTFLVLALLGAGPLLVTWPTRTRRSGRNPYAFAIVIAAICVLWAASVYAEQQGTQAAEGFVRNLPGDTAVVVYSTQQLALNGPGVSVQRLPAGSSYHYRYLGLRLLIIQSGTYYLLPVNWNPEMPFTYIINASDQTRIDLY